MAYYKANWEQMCACVTLTIIDFGNGIAVNFFLPFYTFLCFPDFLQLAFMIFGIKI